MLVDTMCFPKSKPDFTPYYDEEDGSIHEENTNEIVFIPESIHEHVDNLYLNFEVSSNESILAFIYESGNETFIVWTSEEAMEFCYEPFSEIAECPEFMLF